VQIAEAVTFRAALQLGVATFAANSLVVVTTNSDGGLRASLGVY
jgi:hypothetical protein